MRIAIIGCSHGRHAQLKVPEADVLVHTGDFSRRGDESDARDFLAWFEAQPHAEKVLVCGNHDRLSEGNPATFARILARTAPSCHYIHERAVEIAGLRWFGSNWAPMFCHWHWMSERGPDMQAHWDLIPDDTQVLITHGPPMGRLDLIRPEDTMGRPLHQGCGNLRTTIDSRLKSLRLSAFSHLHYQGCQTEGANGVTYVNAATVDDDYQIRGTIQVVEIPA